MTTYLINTESTYKQLQPFTTIEQHNSNIKSIRDQFNDQLTKSEKAILDVLSRYSAKYFGLSYLSKTKIASMLNITRRTVIRACSKFEQLGFIKQFKLKRVAGDKRQSSNAVVFVDVTPECHTEMSHHRSTDKAPDKSPKVFKDNTSSYEPSDTPQSFYSHFKSRLVSMLGDNSKTLTKLTSKLYGIYKVHSIRMLKFGIYSEKSEQLMGLALQAISITLQASKSKKKPIQSLTGFYNGVYKNLISKNVIGITDSPRACTNTTGDDIEWFIPPAHQSAQVNHSSQ